MMDNDQNLNNMNNRTDNQYDNWSMEVDNSHQLYPTPQQVINLRKEKTYF